LLLFCLALSFSPHKWSACFTWSVEPWIFPFTCAVNATVTYWSLLLTSFGYATRESIRHTFKYRVQTVTDQYASSTVGEVINNSACPMYGRKPCVLVPTGSNAI
jgi:hypothetical protein